MRKLLLIGALCCSTAGAINLSDYKKEDVCLTVYPWYISNKLDYKVVNHTELTISQAQQLQNRISREGLNNNRDCKLSLFFTAETTQTTNTNVTLIAANLTLIDMKRINTINDISINNSYETTYVITSKMASDIQFRTYLMYDALITRLLLDLQPARP